MSDDPNQNYLRKAAKNLPPLGAWGEWALKHWKRFRPKEYAELKAAGLLIPALKVSEHQARETFQALVKAGVNESTAEHQALRDHLLLPSEEEEEDDRQMLIDSGLMYP